MSIPPLVIPQTTLRSNQGDQFWPSATGSVTATSPVSTFHMEIDRTVAGGLESLPSSASLTIAQLVSRNNGPFVEFSSSTQPGGPLVGDFGERVTLCYETVYYNPPLPAGSRFRWRTTLIGAPTCVVVGSCTVT